jgi:RNA polymerase sigma factor (sigma-70 family)
MSAAPSTQLATLVEGIRANDSLAWAELIARFDHMLRAIAGSHRLGHADVDDVVQTVWQRLHEHVDRLRDPNAIAGWLATTARHESLRLLRAATREQPTDDLELLDSADVDRPDAEVLASERHDILWRALGTLPTRQRRLMVVLAADARDYRQISAMLDMPVGSIGPTRARTVARLESNPELRELRLASC